MGKNSKALGAGVGGALGILITWLMTSLGGIEVPNEVAGAISMLCSAAVAYFFPSNT